MSSNISSELSYIDTHCHLHLLENVEEKIIEANLVGVGTMLNVFDPTEKNFEDSLDKLSQIPHLYVSVGVHPLSVDKIGFETFYEVFEQSCAKYENIIACGETGVDLYYGRNIDVQLQFLKVHVDICQKYKKILIIHNRSCDVETILQEIPDDIMFIFHSFNMGKEQMEKIVKKGGFVSYSGMITFQKNVSEIQNALKYTPLDNVLFETDSPYLTPVPYRKYKNEPKYLVETYKRAAQIMNQPIETVIEATKRNFFLLKDSVI